MAYRRGIVAKAKIIYQQQNRFTPSFSHIYRDDTDREEWRRNPKTQNYFQNRVFPSGNDFSTSHGMRNFFRDRRFSIPAVFARNFSSGGVEEGAADKIEIMSDVADVFGDTSVEVAAQVVAPLVNEVAIAAADSFFPVAVLQHLIGYVHSYTGFNWWAAIAVTTILIRSVQLPVMINQLKSTTKFTLLRPRLEEIKQEMENSDMSPDAVAEGQARMKKLFKDYGVTPFTPLKGLLITGPIFCSFFFAVRNLAENVPSFKEGGALWFTDLTTPDSMLILPVLTALTFWITVECNAQEGLEGNPTAGTIKNVSRIFAALTIPLTASFPKAIFCYWITSNLFSLMYGLVIRKPEVKKFLGVPIIPVTPPSSDKKPGFSFFGALNKYAAAQQQKSSSSATQASNKSASHSVSSSSSILSQRIKRLEKEVKGRKKGEKM